MVKLNLHLPCCCQFYNHTMHLDMCNEHPSFGYWYTIKNFHDKNKIEKDSEYIRGKKIYLIIGKMHVTWHKK